MIRSILYATDLGLYAPYVLQHAASLARTHHADLYVLHVVEPLGLFAESLLQTYLDAAALGELHRHGLERIMASIEQRVFEEFCDELQESAEEAAPIRAVQVQLGDPPQVILQFAEDLAAELIVIGSHSQGPRASALLGRTCLRLLQQTRVPVYLVPIMADWSESR
ncbi:universal stress protein [Pseudomonas stutzeri]|nr:universal stress protein [Stutzerimonas stutzeri]